MDKMPRNVAGTNGGNGGDAGAGGNGADGANAGDSVDIEVMVRDDDIDLLYTLVSVECGPAKGGAGGKGGLAGVPGR